MYFMYSLYYLVLFSSSYLCAAYYDYFAALTQILRAPCNTNEIGDSRLFLMPDSPQEPMVMLLILLPLPSIHPPYLLPIQSGPSDPSGQSVLSLQANLSHTFKCPKGLISLSHLMIPLPHLNIERDTMKPTPIKLLLPFLSLFRPCTALLLPILFS